MPKRTSKVQGANRGVAGYPEIEALIESEDFDEINGVFAKLHEKLDEIARKKRGLKKGRDAKKVMRALELTMDLFRELLSIKYDLKEHLAQKEKSQ